jgi:hypothetical protein
MTDLAGRGRAWLAQRWRVFLAGGAASGAGAGGDGPRGDVHGDQETKIPGNACRALILNGCSHEVELNVH